MRSLKGTGRMFFVRVREGGGQFAPRITLRKPDAIHLAMILCGVGLANLLH